MLRQLGRLYEPPGANAALLFVSFAVVPFSIVSYCLLSALRTGVSPTL